MLLLRRSFPARRLIGLLLATTLIVAACAGDDDAGEQQSASSSSSTTSTSTPTTSVAGPSTTAPGAPTTSAPVGGPISVLELGVEDCFNAAALSTEPAEVKEVELVPCEEEHDSEVYAETAFESVDPAYPGEDELIDYATRFCVDAFQPYVGLPYADSALTVSHFWPTASAWESGDDRTVYCVVFRKDQPSVGSARDSGV